MYYIYTDALLGQNWTTLNDNFKVALFGKSKIQISFKIKYVIALALKIPELRKLFHLDIQLQKYFMLKWHETNIWQQLSFYFYCFLLSPFANMAANLICIKQNKVFF